MQPDNQSQYDFILDPSQKKTTGPAFLQNPKKRIIALVAFIIGMLLLIIVGVAIFTALTKKDTSAIVDVVAYQTELVRISNLGLEDATDSSVRAQTSTISTFIQSDLAQTSTFLAKQGKKLTELESASKLDPEVVKTLESAKLKNTYDQELLSAIDETSAKYKIALQKALNGASSDKEKSVIQSSATNILTYEKL